MPRKSSWSDAELEALRALPPRNLAALAAFRERYPGHSKAAVTAKLALLRIRREAEDVKVRLGSAQPARPLRPAQSMTVPSGAVMRPATLIRRGKIAFAGYDPSEYTL